MRYLRLLPLLLLGACPSPGGGGATDAGSGPANDCAPDERQCKDDDSATAQVCSFGKFVDLPCGAQQFCDDGECKDPICVADEVQCNSETGLRERCEERGRWYEEEPCSDGQRCVNIGECEDPVCRDRESRCAEADPTGSREYCNDEGSGWITEACGRSERCVNGECRRTLCHAGRVACVDASSFGTCAEDELSFTDVTECPPGEGCSGGVCVSACDLARERSSYDGCTFFAVDLPNYADPQRRQDQHPYAVVLANPNDYVVMASVTKRGGQGNDEVIQLLASVNVPNVGGGQGRTVYSESRTEGGRQQRLSGNAEALAIPPRGMLTMILPPDSAGTRVNGNNVTYVSEKEARAYKVTSTGPVTAYQFQPICCSWSYTNDATILIPAGSLGRHYYAFSHTHVDWTFQGQHESLEAFLTLVGGEESAEVELRMGDRAFQIPPGVAMDGNTMRVTLAPYDVLTILTTNHQDPMMADLTGVEIIADEEISVFGGHLCTYIPHGVLSCDHIETINLPVETWRNSYVGAHTTWRANTRDEVNYYRLMASETTEITFDPPLRDISSHGPIAGGLYACTDLAEGNTLILNAGDWCEFGTKADFHATGTGKFAMTQFITSACTLGDANCGVFSRPPANSADPSMMAVPPTAQYRSQYFFLTPETYPVQYVTIVHGGGAILELDGIGVSAAEMGDRGRTPYLVEDAERIGESAWYRSSVLLGSGQHEILDLTGEPFGIMVYAYDDSVSYAYPGGMDLTKEQ